MEYLDYRAICPLSLSFQCGVDIVLATPVLLIRMGFCCLTSLPSAVRF